MKISSKEDKSQNMTENAYDTSLLILTLMNLITYNKINESFKMKLAFVYQNILE